MITIKYELIVDSREGTRAKECVDWFRTKDKKQNWTSCIRALPYGDYLINNTVVFEYKTAEDYINSIYNESLFNEVYNQSDNYLYNYLIIVGDLEKSIENSFLRSAHIRQHNPSMTKWKHKARKMIKGSIRRCRVRTSIIFCDSQEDAFEEIYYQSIKCLDNKNYSGIVRKIQDKKKDISPNLAYLTYVGGVGEKTAEKVIANLEEDTLINLTKLTYDDLLEIKGVNRENAKKITKWVHGESNITK